MQILRAIVFVGFLAGIGLTATLLVYASDLTDERTQSLHDIRGLISVVTMGAFLLTLFVGKKPRR